MNERAGKLSARLEGLIAPDVLTFDADELAAYGRDWTKVYAPAPCAVARPRNVDEVCAIVRACAELDLAIVPSGGRTGLSGGAVAASGELVLSLDRMSHMGEVDLAAATVCVEAGTVTEAVHHHAEPHGLTWPVDFASKGSSHVGGNIATNAGGVRVIRYGLTRHWVLGLEVVLASGDKLELNGALEKNNTGADLRQLFIGSEGTLGIITAATLKLAPLPRDVRVCLFAVANLSAVLALFREARRAPFTIAAYEFFTIECLRRVRKHRKLSEPFAEDATHYVLLEVEDTSHTLDAWLERALESGLVVDGTVAEDHGRARDLWVLRESISESLSATGLPHKNDISLPVSALEAFCAELDAVFQARYPGFEICLFGHIGDGNLHVNVMKPDALSNEAFFAWTKESDPTMFELVRKHRGSISAEHGIGLLKKPFLHYSRTPEELALLRSIKRALDPKNLLNPGKIFDV